MITKANFKRAEKAAYALLELNEVTELPVKIKKLVKPIPNLEIKSYSWMMKKHGMTFEEVCEFANSDEGCCYREASTGRYLILYNDTTKSLGRVRWTIAHELGHYMLKHNEKSDKTIIARSSLTDTEYDVFEQEANCFARTLLAPPNVLTALGKFDPPTLIELCQLSGVAAHNVYEFMSKGIKMGVRHTHNKVSILFSQFIYRYKYGLECYHCGHFFTSEDARYCSVCGQDSLIRPLYYMGVDAMKYLGFELDENGRAFVCPRCENEELERGDHCKVCGVLVVNKCSSAQYYNNSVYYDCDTILDGNARFCTTCGEESTFFKNGLLKSWEKEKKEIEEKPDPFLNPFPSPFVSNPKFNKPKSTPIDDEEVDIDELLS